MSLFVDFLADLQRTGQSIVIPAGELHGLVERFGPRVRNMGYWNHGTDGSLEVSTVHLAEAARNLGNSLLTEAVRELRDSRQLTGVLHTSGAAARFIDEMGRIYLAAFEEKIRHFQNTRDPDQAARLSDEVSRELFGR